MIFSSCNLSFLFKVLCKKRLNGRFLPVKAAPAGAEKLRECPLTSPPVSLSTDLSSSLRQGEQTSSTQPHSEQMKCAWGFVFASYRSWPETVPTLMTSPSRMNMASSDTRCRDSDPDTPASVSHTASPRSGAPSYCAERPVLPVAFCCTCAPPFLPPKQ